MKIINSLCSWWVVNWMAVVVPYEHWCNSGVRLGSANWQAWEVVIRGQWMGGKVASWDSWWLGPFSMKVVCFPHLSLWVPSRCFGFLPQSKDWIVKDLKSFIISPKTIKSPKAIKRCECEWVVVCPLWGPARNRRFVWAGMTPLPLDIRKSPQHCRHPDNRMIEHWWMWSAERVVRTYTDYTLTSLTFLLHMFSKTLWASTTRTGLHYASGCGPVRSIGRTSWAATAVDNGNGAKTLTSNNCNTEPTEKEMDSFIDTLNITIFMVCDEKHALFSSHTP